MSRSTLARLSDKELLNRVFKLNQKERETTHAILLHLNEIERRELYLSQGYGSLFDYCVEHLKYSRSAAARRLRTARCIKNHPEVGTMLRRGEVNLSTVSLVASSLNDSNKNEILRGIRNKSQREVESIVARYQKAVPLRDRVKPVRAPVVVTSTGAMDKGWGLLSGQCRSGTNSAPDDGSNT